MGTKQDIFEEIALATVKVADLTPSRKINLVA